MIVTEFNNIRDDIIGNKLQVPISSIISRARELRVTSIVERGHDITVNGTYVITRLSVISLARHFGVAISDVVSHLKTFKFYIAHVKLVSLVWVKLPTSTLGFLKTSYSEAVPCQRFDDSMALEEVINALLSNHLHVDIAALAAITRPVNAIGVEQLNKSYVLLNHIKNMQKFLQAGYSDNPDVYIEKDSKAWFNSKLLTHDSEPVMVCTHLGDKGQLLRISVTDIKYFEPVYADPFIDPLVLRDLSIEFGDSARRHLAKFKYDLISGTNIHESLDKFAGLCSQSLQLAPYVRGIVVPQIYKQASSLAIKVFIDDVDFYIVGNLVNSVFTIRTVLPKNIVALNSATIGSLYTITS